MRAAARSREVTLRRVIATDLPIFFAQQGDRTANHMAAFTAADPADRIAFDRHWTYLLANREIVVRSAIVADEVAGYAIGFSRFGKPEIGYWIGRDFWGCGIATATLRLFLGKVSTRPLYARAASDNRASIRVLEKCGFRVWGYDTAYATARGVDIAETLLRLV